MSFFVLLALLAAAALHAGWNALVRRDGDRGAATLALAAGSVVVCGLLLPFLPAMSTAAIPYVIGSAFIHFAYYTMIAWAYRHGELSFAYPIMRGLAPVLVTAFAVAFIEPTTWQVVLGIAVVAAGILSLGIEGVRRNPGGLVPAVGNAFVIAAYTLVDGLGARVSEAPATYVAWVLVASGLVTLAPRIVMGGKAALAPLRPRIPVALMSGAMSFGAYAIALWAMTVAPIGAVSAVRETSVLFAAAIGAILLHERFGALRWVAVVLVMAGLALVKSSG